jgi:hypothetical protein
VTRWPSNAARSNPSAFQKRRRWSGSITPPEPPRDGSPFAERPETLAHVNFLARWVWLPLMVTALLIIIGSQRPAPTQTLPPCAIDLTDYTSL